VQTGQLRRWPEAQSHLSVSVDADTELASAALGPARPSSINAFWSIASTKGAGSGFFYAEPPRDGVLGATSQVALARSARVQDIRDASALDYSEASIGPVPPGGIVVVHNPATRRYLALVVDTIEPVDPRTAGAGPYAYADVTWYLAEAGSADFSSAP
jgi:hypothetical protein